MTGCDKSFKRQISTCGGKKRSRHFGKVLKLRESLYIQWLSLSFLLLSYSSSSSSSSSPFSFFLVPFRNFILEKFDLISLWCGFDIIYSGYWFFHKRRMFSVCTPHSTRDFGLCLTWRTWHCDHPERDQELTDWILLHKDGEVGTIACQANLSFIQITKHTQQNEHECRKKEEEEKKKSMPKQKSEQSTSRQRSPLS